MKILSDAEQRARHQWEASHIQKKAIITAKSEAKLAFEKAESAKAMLEGASVTTLNTEAMLK